VLVADVPWTVEGLTRDKLSYPTPATFQMQWVAAADFDRVTDRALQRDLPNEILRLGGPAALDGYDLTRIMGDVLGPHVAGMIAGMYGGIQANANDFQPRFLIDAEAIETRFDIKLTSISEWVSEHRAQFEH